MIKTRFCSVRIALLLAGLLSLPNCVGVRPPGLLPQVPDEPRASWRTETAVSTDGDWSCEAIFVPGRQEESLLPDDLAVSVDGRTVPFQFDPSYGRLRVSLPGLEPGAHSLLVVPSSSSKVNFPPLNLKFDLPQ